MFDKILNKSLKIIYQLLTLQDYTHTEYENYSVTTR